MTGTRRGPFRLWTLMAFAALTWAMIGLAFASLAPPAVVPRIFQNYHVEHFAAFYVVTLLTAAALPQARLTWIALSIAFLAAAFAAFRILALIHKLFSAEDFLCDLLGIVAALVPIFVGRFRQISAT